MKCFVVYGISDCPSCLRVCADLMENEQEYVFVNCDFSKSFRKSIRDELNWPTFPIIMLRADDENLVIGGGEQFKDYIASLLALT
jgi:glutaredoxin-related protein|tara:strand:+ start:1116 stop:1370 length:255 start_codon:yes stop_codon:yes gene_type:complete